LQESNTNGFLLDKLAWEQYRKTCGVENGFQPVFHCVLKQDANPAHQSSTIAANHASSGTPRRLRNMVNWIQELLETFSLRKPDPSTEPFMSNTITAKELQRIYASNNQIELIDVRTPVEFQELHVAFAQNAPLERLDPLAYQKTRKSKADDRLYIICRSGSRGKQACVKFEAAGIANVVNIEGGTLACEAAGLDVVRGKKAISLERQVRIAAGSIVAIGSALTLLSPYWIVLPLFIGCGLVFSGVTDTCGMGMVIAKMPWNQRGRSGSAAVACDR
jgi:rhodanese-related sulfurtransferase